MSAAWVAGAVRARAMARRRLGAAAARELAASPSLATAVAILEGGPYGRGVRSGQTLAEAQHGVAAAVLWHLRVLAGWLPPSGADLLRLLAGWGEIANTDELLHRMAGGAPAEEFRLGALATAWPRLARATTPAQLRAALTRSAWDDPRGDAPRDLRLGMRLSWAVRVAAAIPRVAPWAAGAAAVLVAGERFVARQDLRAAALEHAKSLLGPEAPVATTLPELAERLPADAGWALAGIRQPGDLWRAEARWWHRVEQDGFDLLAAAGFTFMPALGAVAVLAADAWRVRATLELTARGGQHLQMLDLLDTPGLPEAADALA